MVANELAVDIGGFFNAEVARERNERFRQAVVVVLGDGIKIHIADRARGNAAQLEADVFIFDHLAEEIERARAALGSFGALEARQTDNGVFLEAFVDLAADIVLFGEFFVENFRERRLNAVAE